MSNYPIGPETQRKAAATQAGRLANALNRVLYGADTYNVKLRGSSGTIKRWGTEVRVYAGNGNKLPDGVPASDGNDSYFDTEELMRAIRDYLEFQSFVEVIP